MQCALFFQIIKFVRESKRLVDLVTKIGFQHILELDNCYVPRAFAQWIADCTVPDEKVIKLQGKSVQLSTKSVVQSLGIPEGFLPVETDEEIGKASFLAAFNLTDIPTIKYFGNKILFEKNISDHEFRRCFMVVCNGTFLCPNSNTKPSTIYLGALVDVDKIKDRDWAKFVHDWLILFISKYLKKKRRVDNKYLTLGGCIYHLAVRCLDFLDFGSIELPKTMPRIRVWKGDMIKHFSDMTIGRDGKYGARSIIEEAQTCYGHFETHEPNSTVNPESPENANMENIVHTKNDTIHGTCIHGAQSKISELLSMLSEKSISSKIKEEIASTFQNMMKDEDMNAQSKAAELVLHCVRLLIHTNGESGDTEKLISEQDLQNSSNIPNESQNTLKLDSTESVNPESVGVSLMIKKRRAPDDVSSQQSIKSEYQQEHKVAKICEQEEINNEVNDQITHTGQCPTEKETTTVNDKDNTGSSASLNHMLETDQKSEIKLGKEALPDFNYDYASSVERNVFAGFKNSYNIVKSSNDDINDSTHSQQPPANEILQESGIEQVNIILPNVLVNVSRDGECKAAVVKELMQDGFCSVAIETSGYWKEVTVHVDTIHVIKAKKHDNIKILRGPMSGCTGTVIGVDNSDGIVRVQGFAELKIIELDMLGILKILPDQQEESKRNEKESYNNGKEQKNKENNIGIKSLGNEENNIGSKSLGNGDYKITSYTDWSLYIDEARKKYHFNDDSVPSFRLFEYTDERGTYIDELVLWRPLDMSSADYNTKIENAKHNYRIMYDSFHTKKQHSLSSKSTNIECNESRIQCAQRQPNFCDLTESPDKNEHSITKNLDPPAHTLSRNIDSSSTKSSSKTPTSTRYFKEEIVGRRLFHDDNDICQNSSQEIQCMGTKFFSESCKVMSCKTDDFYNANLSLGTASSISGKENLPPKRILQPSKFLSSPYENNLRRPITAIEYKMYEVLTTLCDDDELSIKWEINMDNCKVSLEQLGKSFKQDGWVEAYVINSFCRKLFKDNHPKQSGKHYFFNTASDYFLEKWKTEDGRIDLKEKTFRSFKGASLARPLHLAKRLYFPTGMSLHWFVFAVDIKSRNFLFLDSIYGKHDSFQVIASELLIKNFIITWHETGQKKIDFSSFEKVYPNVPKQKGGDNCGIHCMKLMELYCARNPASYAFSDGDIPYFRIRYAIDNLFTTHNTESYVKNLVSNFDLKAYKEKKQIMTID